MRYRSHKSVITNLLFNSATKSIRFHGLIILGAIGFFLVADFNAEYILSIGLQYPGIDKAAHFIFHLLLVISLYILGRNLWHQQECYRSLLTAFALALLIGICDELQQLFVAGRDFDFYDFLANVCGVSTAVILISKYPQS